MKQSSGNSTNHKLLAILESIRSTLTIDAGDDTRLAGRTDEESGQPEEDASDLNIPVLNNIVNLSATGTGIDLDDLDNLDLTGNPIPKSFEKQQAEQTNLNADSNPANRAADTDELLNRLFSPDEISMNSTDTDDEEYTIRELAELLHMEAEQIREEILAEFIPRMEQSFKARLQDATSEILGELVERRMQARLKGYK